MSKLHVLYSPNQIVTFPNKRTHADLHETISKILSRDIAITMILTMMMGAEKPHTHTHFPSFSPSRCAHRVFGSESWCSNRIPMQYGSWIIAVWWFGT